MLSMAGIMVIMSLALRLVDTYGRINVMLPPLLVYSVLALMATRQIINERAHLVDPYYVEGRKDIFNITYTLFPNCILPLYLSCLTFANYRMGFVFIAIFLLFTFITFPRANILWPIRVVYSELRGLIRGR
jgi:hypothetical protein